jgi:6-phosphogluconolactonase
VLPDAAALAERAAAWLGENIAQAVAERGQCCLAASGGRTPWAMYAALARQKDLPWERVHLLQVDERAAPPGHAERNLEGLRAALAPVAARLQWHPMPVESEDLQTAAAHYTRALEGLCGAPPVLDIVHLGLGDDGHTASLIPGDPALAAAECVAATAPYKGWRRMTLTLPVLDRARQLLWVVAGAEKAIMLRRLLAADAGIPAGRVSQARAVLLADAAAMG